MSTRWLRNGRTLIGAVLATFAVVGCGGGASTPQPSGTPGLAARSVPSVTWAIPASDNQLNAVTGFDYGPQLALTNVMQGLVSYTADGIIKPGLASSWAEPNSTTYVYHLRHGLRFSNGVPLTAQQVAWSMRQSMNPSTGAEASSYYSAVAAITASGPFTVTVRLKHPSSTWRYVPGTQYGYIYERGAVEQGGGFRKIGAVGNLPVGTGPYKVQSFVPASSVTLVRNPLFAGTAPRVQRATIQFVTNAAGELASMQAGALQGASYVPLTDTPQWAAISSIKLLSAPADAGIFIIFNTARAPLSDVNVRRALVYALDSAGIVRNVLHGNARVATSFVPPEVWAGDGLTATAAASLYSHLPSYSFSLDSAQRALSQSAYPHGFSLTVNYDSQVAAEVGNALQVWASDLAKIGIHMTVREVQPAQYTAPFANPQAGGGIWMGTFAGDYPDPLDLWPEVVCSCDKPPNGYNISNFHSTAVDADLSAAEASSRAPTRVQRLNQVLTVANRVLPIWTPWWDNFIFAMNKAYNLTEYGPWEIYTPWLTHLGYAK